MLSDQEMERAQARGDADEEELRALEMDVTGKVDLQRECIALQLKR